MFVCVYVHVHVCSPSQLPFLVRYVLKEEQSTGHLMVRHTHLRLPPSEQSLAASQFTGADPRRRGETVIDCTNGRHCLLLD